ncbi:MAG: formylglycine-generating enzyme family protein [Desulfuromonadales bacterium]|jgi:formylglycine-generating enzyme required for sulfatase activity|nr:formylglycine-generating enzyme family protein [Desulfuromonadales bacterium]
MHIRLCNFLLGSLVLLVISAATNAIAAEQSQNYTDKATGMEFVLVPGGCYQMGNLWGGGSYTEYPVHEVCVDSFYLGKTEVTQGQWQKLMKENPATFKLGDDYPVESISRAEVSDFLKKMGDKKFRLPTEAEWEFACRSGGKEEQFCGGDSVKEVAWYDKNSGENPQPVAQKQPNGLGLYDMSGNVWEFCSDIFARIYYESSPRENPQGAASGQHYIKRGGTWDINENFQRSVTRGRGSYDEKHYSTGFRVAFPAKP